LMKSLTSL